MSVIANICGVIELDYLDYFIVKKLLFFGFKVFSGACIGIFIKICSVHLHVSKFVLHLFQLWLKSKKGLKHHV